MRKSIVVLAAATTLPAALWIVLTGAPAGAAPGQTAHGIPVTIGFSDLNPMVGNALTIPSNCPFDSSAEFLIPMANGVMHQTGNANGFWAGGTVEGAAELVDSTVDGFSPYFGHATYWTGFGTNRSQTDTTGQAEEGETFDFAGTNGGGQPLQVHIQYHGTKNDSGTITNFSESVICS
jgi:hypothetical protein